MRGSWREFAKRRAQIELRRLGEFRAEEALKRNLRLWSWLRDYISKTDSTGCSYHDYWAIYRHVRQCAPQEILECGTGVSSVVMAAALLDNEESGCAGGRITSMEDDERWMEMANELLPDELRRFVEFILGPSVEGTFSLFRGMQYRDLPERSYDFVFVDGPGYRAPDGAMTFDLDLLHVLERAEVPVRAIVDKRVSTCYVLQQVLGEKRVRYVPWAGKGYVAPSTRYDLRIVREDTPSLSFAKSFALLGRTRLSFTSEAVAPSAKKTG